MKNFSTALSGFFATVKWCLVLSWLSSKLYTTIRIAADIVTPLLAIVMAFVGKYILDLLSTSGTQDISYARNTLVLFFLGLASIYILRPVRFPPPDIRG